MATLLHLNSRILLNAILAGVAYYFLVRFGIALKVPPGDISSFWPANSVILSALLLTEKRYWWIFIVAFAPSEIIPNLQADHSFLRSVVFYLANVVEILIAAFALKPVLGSTIKFDQLRKMVLFLLWAVLIGPMSSASIASIIPAIEVGADYWFVWRIWFFADALGHLALTPVIILFISSGSIWLKEKSFTRMPEALILISSLFVVGIITLGSDTTANFPALLFAPVPILLWASLRFGPIGTSTTVLIISLLTILTAINGYGPFTSSFPAQNSLSLQLFLVGISIPMLLLSSLFSEHKQTVEILRESNERFKASFTNASIGMALVSLDHKIIEANQAFYNMLGYSENDINGKFFKDITHPDDIALSIDYHKKLLADEIETYQYEKRYLHKKGHEVWALLNASIVRNNDDHPLYIIAQIQNITETKQANELLSYQASHDALTGLVNRREFERRTERLLSTIQKNNDGQHALCFMDLDQFKVINDTCGHNAGDEMLRQISSILRRVIRHRDTLARLGGDEFGVLMEYCSLDDAHRVATSLQKAIHDFNFIWEDHTFKVGVSIGLVPIIDTIPSLHELLKEADAACYMAKDKGRNRIHVYHAEDSEIVKRHGEMQWVERLYQALDENRFCLYAQTIAPLHGKEENHYEILIRMIDEQGASIPPNAFLPAAERYNLISRIDQWVIEKTFNVLKENRHFLEKINFCSINLSGSSLTDPSILDFIISQLEQLKIDGNKICFEITETAAILNMNNATKFIAILNNLGCRFALDDFGSGLSSFAYLKNLPVDYLKIDGMFVKDIVDDPIDHAMVKSINEIGKVMNMKTIAEFVENDVIKGMLKEIGVDYAQGYGIGKPQPLDDLLKQSENDL